MSEQKIIDFLLKWAENYFKSKDAFYKKIKTIENKKDYFIIKFKDKTDTILALPKLIDIYNHKKSKESNLSIITINNRKNVEMLYHNWQEITNYQSLKIYFINPFATTEKKWIINPHIHAKICDIDSLKVGIMSMFETVEPLTEELLITKI